jgi:hypothetical protein
MRKEGLDLLDRQDNRGLPAFRTLTYMGDGIVGSPFPTLSNPRRKGPISTSLLDCWRPRRDLNPCYRRESGMAKRNSNKLQEHGRTGWRSRSRKKHLIVSPMCPRIFEDFTKFTGQETDHSKHISLEPIFAYRFRLLSPITDRDICHAKRRIKSVSPDNVFMGFPEF